MNDNFRCAGLSLFADHSDSVFFKDFLSVTKLGWLLSIPTAQSIHMLKLTLLTFWVEVWTLV